MNTLIVTAHPSPEGHTHQIAAAYREAREKRGDHVESLDLAGEGSYEGDDQSG